MNGWLSYDKMREINELVFGLDSQDHATDQSNALHLSIDQNVESSQNDERDQEALRKRLLREEKKQQKFKEFLLGCDEDVQIFDPSSSQSRRR